MLRDMGKRLARGTGRANEAPAIATEVATSSQQSVCCLGFIFQIRSLTFLQYSSELIFLFL